MQAEGTLTLFAELSIAFAGFTGVVSALRHRADERTVAVQENELRLLVEFSILLLIKSVLPLALWNAGVSELGAWRLASAYAAIETVIYYTLRFSTLRNHAPVVGTVFLGSVAVDWVFAVGLVLGAANALPWSPAPVYLMNLLWVLVGTALSFVRLVQPIWGSNGRHTS